MKEQNPAEELLHIRSMMEQSSRFLSLSGLSGIMAGAFGLIASIAVHAYLAFQPSSVTDAPEAVPPSYLLVIGVAVLCLSLLTTILLSWRKAKRASQTLWTVGAKLLIAKTGIPLLAGGMVVLSFYGLELYGLMAPFSMIFYGLALWVGGRASFEELNVLGSLQISLGILSLWMLPYNIWIWGIGFGLLHIVYGLYLHLKYER